MEEVTTSLFDGVTKEEFLQTAETLFTELT